MKTRIKKMKLKLCELNKNLKINEKTLSLEVENLKRSDKSSDSQIDKQYKTQYYFCFRNKN
jgi:hypothetical protein